MSKNSQRRRARKAKALRNRATRAGEAFGASRGPTTSGRQEPPPEQLSPEQHADEFITLAVRLARQRDQLRVEQALRILHELTGTGRGRRLVALELANRLREAITLAWQNGWQPIDLHRVAARKLADPQRPFLADAVAEELTRYAAATIDPRWPAQLAEIEAVVWWPPDQTYLHARAEAAGSWLPVLTGGVHLLALLAALPPLQQLGPVPGAADPAATPRRREAGDVDERILSRVRALLAKAESTTFEAEAEALTAAAQSLMARHSIDAALLAATDGNRQGGPAARRIGIDNPYDSQKVLLLDAVARANRCRTVWSRELGFSTLVGFEADMQAVETLFTSLLVQATSAMTREGSQRDAYGRSRTRSYRASFLAAFADRIGERLAEVTRSETEAATTRASSASPGADGAPNLLPVLAARSDAVDEAVDEMFSGGLVSRRVSRPTHADGWYAGRSAADRARIGAGAAIEG
jgi:hypothetical protein